MPVEPALLDGSELGLVGLDVEIDVQERADLLAVAIDEIAAAPRGEILVLHRRRRLARGGGGRRLGCGLVGGRRLCRLVGLHLAVLFLSRSTVASCVYPARGGRTTERTPGAAGPPRL